jgi:hypothetical protein
MTTMNQLPALFWFWWHERVVGVAQGVKVHQIGSHKVIGRFLIRDFDRMVAPLLKHCA